MEKGKPGYRAVPLSMNRQMVAATLDIARQQNNIQAMMEVESINHGPVTIII